MLFAFANPRLASFLTEFIRGKSLTAVSKLPSDDPLSMRMSSKLFVWVNTELKQSTSNDPPLRLTTIIEYNDHSPRAFLHYASDLHDQLVVLAYLVKTRIPSNG